MAYDYEAEPDFPLLPDDEAKAQEDAAKERAEAREAALSRVVGTLEKEAKRRVDNRSALELRWLDDLYQYHGQLTPGQIEALNKANAGSRLVVNQTRTKTNTMAARLSDLLFPTDDTNWSVDPTPVPRLTKEAAALQTHIDKLRAQAAQMAQQAQAQAAQQAQAQPGPGGQPMPQPAAQPAPQQDPQKLIEEADVFQRRLASIQDQTAIAARASENMTLLIEDQLVDCCYAAEARLVIEDACKLGTGIMKGPVLDPSVGRYWAVLDDGVTAVLKEGPAETSIAMKRVDPWHFFPDMSRQTVSAQDGVFERHMLNESDLRKLARSPGFNREAIKRLISAGSRTALPTRLSDLSRINLSASTDAALDHYEVWEYHGPVSGDDLKAVAEAMMRVDIVADAAERWPGDVRQIKRQPQPMALPAPSADEAPMEGEDETETVVAEIELTAEANPAPSFEDFEVDPLSEVQIVAWFCDGKLLKFEISPNERNDLPYSVYCIEPDEACPFGYGVPYMIRNTQDAFNAILRMMMDNGGVTAGPQVIMNQEKIAPADDSGDYTIRPRKTWKFTQEIVKDDVPYAEIRLDSHLSELMPILQIMLKFMDDEAAIPLIAAGEQGSTQTKTMGGMTILMNAANIIFKRAVKRFDDDMTTPNIRRLFDWNMTYSRDPAIKGDSQVNAKGSSVLLVREMVASNLMIIAKEFGAHPVFGPMLKSPSVLRQIFRAQGMTVDESVYTDEELKRIAENAPPEQGDPMKMRELELRQMEIDARVQVANMQTDSAQKVEMLRRETEMLKLAQQSNVKLDEIEAMLSQAAAEREHKERLMAAEIGAQEMQAGAAAQAGRAPQIAGDGGGGYI